MNAPTAGSAGPAGRLAAEAALRFRTLMYTAQCYALCHMAPLRLFFAVLRRVRPLARIGGVFWVTRADDVREALERFDDFELSQFIGPRMPWGAFMMTIDGRAQHALERGLLQSVVRVDDDIRAIRSLAADECRRQAGDLARPGRVDVVARLAEPVAVRIAAEYFGVTPLAGDSAKMADAMADLAGVVMVEPPVGSAPWARSRDSISQVAVALIAQIADRKQMLAGDAGAIPDDLMTRLLKLRSAGGRPAWFDDEWIRCYLMGLIATGGATIVRAAAHAIDQLLAHPEGLRQAQALAEKLVRTPHDQAVAADFQQTIHEALRFRPMLPLLVRDCPRDTVLAAGTPRARVARAGERVITAPLSAMFDEERVEAPSRFRAGRPPDDYLLFGHGARSCFGRYIAETALREIVLFVLTLPGLARAPGAEGRVRYEGPAARALVVTHRGHARGAT